MIGFGIRLAVAGGREAATRLVIIALTMAMGVGLLLTALAGIHAVHAQSDRYIWLNAARAEQVSNHDPVSWRLTEDFFDRKSIGRVDVAATGPNSPVPPGMPRLPGPGEFYASPKLSELLQKNPHDQLADRYPGRQVGTIGKEALPSPDSLIIVIGHTSVPDGEKVTTIPSSCDNCNVDRVAAGFDLILAVVAGALIFPLIMLVGAATRLAAARREQRFAAMRLVGATPRQVSVISAVESTVSAAAGTALGFALFAIFRDRLAGIPFTGLPFFPADLSLQTLDILAVGIGVPLASAIVARFALRRVRISPLGVSRRVTPRAPRAYRLIPLGLGLAELAYFIDRRPPTSNAQVAAFLPGFLVIMVGLVIAGPWFTMVAARVLARRARRPAALIAARRLADNPQTAFRSVSGLVLALFVTSVSVGVITSIVAERGSPTTGSAATNVTALLRDNPTIDRPSAIPGARGMVQVHQAPDELIPQVAGIVPYAFADCADIARNAAFGLCENGAQVAWVYPDLQGPDGQPATWPTASVGRDALRGLPTMSVVVGTDGSRAAIEQARTALEIAYPQPFPPGTVDEWQASFTSTLNLWKQLANVVILASLVIAGCSLAVGVAGGITERKRPFSLLRLTGVPLRTLRRVVALETTAPLLAAAAVAGGTGFLAAHLFLVAQMHYAVRPPGVAYYAIVGAGLALSLAIIASTLPLLRRITGPETARNE